MRGASSPWNYAGAAFCVMRRPLKNPFPCLTQGPLPPSAMSKWDGGFGPVKDLDDWPNANKLKRDLPDIKDLLYNHINFFGISNYARCVCVGV